MNISTDPEIIDDVIYNTKFDFQIIDHPMRPFGLRYWRYTFNILQGVEHLEDYLEKHSPQACSWLRDQEYLVDLRFYDKIEMIDGGMLDNWLFFLPKVR